MQFNHSLSLFLIGIVALAGCADNGKAKKDVLGLLLDLENEAITKEFKNDTSFLSSIMDSTFIELSKNGLKNKHEVLRTIWQDNLKNQSQKLVRDSFKLIDPIVHDYGNAAVVTFIIKTFNHRGDSLFTRNTRFYDVWVKRDKEWKAVTWQGTPLDY